MNCVICGTPIPYTFGRPRKVCSDDCWLEWRRRKRQQQLLMLRVQRIAQAPLEFVEPNCECGCDIFAWTLEGVFCEMCGLENLTFSRDVWLPAEFIPTPVCHCKACMARYLYKVQLYA